MSSQGNSPHTRQKRVLRTRNLTELNFGVASITCLKTSIFIDLVLLYVFIESTNNDNVISITRVLMLHYFVTVTHKSHKQQSHTTKNNCLTINLSSTRHERGVWFSLEINNY